MENVKLEKEEQDPLETKQKEEEHYFEIMARHEIPLHKILFDLSLIDQVKFASTNTKIKECALTHSKILRNIEERSFFNLDLFPNMVIEREQIQTVHRTFGNLTKLKIDMAFAEHSFLDEIRIFKNLKKISVYIGLGDHNYNREGAYIEAVTIKAKFLNSNTDVIYSLMRQIKGMKVISLYNGNISLGLTRLMEIIKLRKLKIHNSSIKSCYYFIKFILEAKSLEYLKITSDNYGITPEPIFVASDIISQLNAYELNLKYFSFTVDTCCKVKYEYLVHLKKLQKLVIYYSVQNQTLNLAKLINVVEKMENVETIFIEFVDKCRLFNRAMFEATERKSYYFKNIIKSTSRYIEVREINFDELRQDPLLQYLNLNN